MSVENEVGEGVRHMSWEALPLEEVKEGVSRKLISGDRTMVAQIFLARGAVVPLHSHENEQVTYILDGALRFTIGKEGKEVVVRTGEVLHIPSGVPHSAEALEDTLDLDVFSPPRQDWLDGTDAYLRDTES